MSEGSPENRASVLTAPGRGAVAVVAAEGPAALSTLDAHFRAANGKPSADQPLDRVVFGHWCDDACHAEEVIVCRCNEWQLEIHCHGGIAAPQRILDAMANAGCEIKPWQDWLRHTAGDPLAAEAEIAIAAATTRRTAAILLDQRQGALRAAIEAARAELNNGLLVEAQRTLDALASHAALGLHLTRPWHVAVAGKPNVGKSSLVNALVGYERAIVFDQPGTTRDVLAAETAIDGWPVRLTDTAGLRSTADSLEAEGVALAKGQLTSADLVLWVLDATALSAADAPQPLDAATHELAAEAPHHRSTIPLLVVVNKIDLVPALVGAHGEASYVSARTGAGVEALLTAIAQKLAPHPPAPGDPVPFAAHHLERLAAATDALARSDPTAASAELTHWLQAAPG